MGKGKSKQKREERQKMHFKYWQGAGKTDRERPQGRKNYVINYPIGSADRLRTWPRVRWSLWPRICRNGIALHFISNSYLGNGCTAWITPETTDEWSIAGYLILMKYYPHPRIVFGGFIASSCNQSVPDWINQMLLDGQYINIL